MATPTATFTQAASSPAIVVDGNILHDRTVHTSALPEQADNLRPAISVNTRGKATTTATVKATPTATVTQAAMSPATGADGNVIHNRKVHTSAPPDATAILSLTPVNGQEKATSIGTANATATTPAKAKATPATTATALAIPTATFTQAATSPATGADGKVVHDRTVQTSTLPEAAVILTPATQSVSQTTNSSTAAATSSAPATAMPAQITTDPAQWQLLNDGNAHLPALLDVAGILPRATPESATTMASGASTSALPPMAPKALIPAAQTRTDAFADGDGLPAARVEKASAGEAPPSAPVGAVGPASQPATANVTDHEAALRAALITAQGGSVPPAAQNTSFTGGDLLAAMQGAVTAATQPATTLVSSALTGLPVAGIKGLPTNQTPSAANPAASAAADRQHKPAASDEVSTQDSSSAGQGSDAQDQGSGKSQVADQVASAVIAQDSQLAAHSGPVAATMLSAAPAPSHTDQPMHAATASAPSPAAPAPMPQPEAVAMPVVNSAKLIQSIQQSDMRVGLNSAEFGEISIHTSTDRGVISSEITLGHAELAKTLSAHLATAQELPGIPQTFSVRVDTSSSTTADSGGFSQQAQGGRQQQEAGRPTQSQSRDTSSQPWSEQTLPIAARSHDGLNTRLDIRI